MVHARTILVVAAVTALSLIGASPAAADIPNVFTVLPSGANPHPITCHAQSDGTRFCVGTAGVSQQAPQRCDPTGLICSSAATTADPRVPDTRVPSFDGMPLDVNVTLPAAAGGDGGYPLVVLLHGYGGAKKDPDDHEAPWIPTAHEWARRGYAVVNMSDRGFGQSCGSAASRQAAVASAAAAQNPSPTAACVAGWVRLLDMRFEVRDAQYLAGLLVDQGVADPSRIGAVGESYGGGASLDLATLKDRQVNADGTLSPWTSPVHHAPLHIAAAAPTIPWSDLISSLTPNGRGLDYAVNPDNANYTPIGIEKQSFVSGLYALGNTSGYYATPGQEQAMQMPVAGDLTRWFGDINAGEPYEANPEISSLLSIFHSYKGALYALDGTAGAGGDAREPPAPMLLSNGFTDDLFPVDETVRYVNLEQALHPGTPYSLWYFDYGHQRGANKDADVARLSGAIQGWFDHYVRGDGGDPGVSTTVLTQTCPKSAASGGPYTADTWFDEHPGTLPFASAAPQTISSTGGNPQSGTAYDPIAGNDACASTTGDEPNSAAYALPAATGAGYTMIGAPTVVADLAVTGTYPEVAARLLDVAPDGSQTLVARGVYRPTGDGKPEVFQLHPGAWRFAPGHAPKLELLGRDAPYVRASNGQFQISVSNLFLFLPTRETSGNGILRGVALPLPPGYTAAPGSGPTISLAAFHGVTRIASGCAVRRKAKPRHRGRGRHRKAARRARGAVRHARHRKPSARHRKPASTCSTPKRRGARRHHATHRSRAHRRARR